MIAAMLSVLAICVGACVGALALGTWALHLFGSLLLTLAGIGSVNFVLLGRAG